MAVATFEAVRNFPARMLEGLALQRRLRELLAGALGPDDMALGAVAEHDFHLARN
jgi:hypothetical protein